MANILIKDTTRKQRLAGAKGMFAAASTATIQFSYISAIFHKVFAVLMVIISPIPVTAVFFHQFAFAYNFRSNDQNAVFPQISTFSSSAIEISRNF